MDVVDCMVICPALEPDMAATTLEVSCSKQAADDVAPSEVE